MIGALASCNEGSETIGGMPAQNAERTHKLLDESAGADWQRAHAELCSLARSRAGLDFDEGRWLVLALRSGAHVRLGYGSFAEYVERLFGYSPRLTHDKLRVAEALEGLPVLAQALRAGEASWSALRELTRAAVPSTERQWLEAARGKTVREVEQLVSGHRPGSQPCDARDSAATRHVLRFEVSSEALATFREAMAKIRRDAGQPLDDDAAILLLARHVLVGPADAGRASYQIALTVCEACQHAQQHGRGELIDVGPDVRAMAACDAQHIGMTHVGAMSERGAQAIASNDVDSTEETTAVHPEQSTRQSSVPRAQQDIPPAIRRWVLRRDGGRCAFPGCRHATFLDVHHIQPRAEEGAHDPNNLITACSAHHRAIHRGEVSLEGSVSAGLRVRHANGTAYGARVSPAAADAHAKIFRALRGLGFREGEARRALADVATHVGHDMSVERLLRRALLELTGGGAARTAPSA
jgi:hypothetical protein